MQEDAPQEDAPQEDAAPDAEPDSDEPDSDEPDSDAPTPDPTASPEPSPPPTATPVPTPTPQPRPPDDQIVLEGDGWFITLDDVDRMSVYIEEVLELEFTEPVIVESHPDIGAEFASNLDIFPADEWNLLELLGLIDEGVTRDAVNQARRDRIRGVCCDDPDGRLAVIVEPRSTRLETEVIVVHELVHALHRQHGNLVGGPGRSGGFEQPTPYGATFEAIAQFVAFRYLDEFPEDQQAIVNAELPITTPELAAISGRVPGEWMDFAYFSAPPLAEAVYAERGAEGLIDLIGRPPTTTEQVLYPRAWLDDEDRVSQDRPIPAAQVVDEGRIGVAVLRWMLDEVATRVDIEPLLAEWTGDRWATYQQGGTECLVAVIEMDSSEAAEELGELLVDREFADVDLASVSDRHIGFDTCGSVEA